MAKVLGSLELFGFQFLLAGLKSFILLTVLSKEVIKLRFKTEGVGHFSLGFHYLLFEVSIEFHLVLDFFGQLHSLTLHFLNHHLHLFLMQFGSK